MTDIKLNDNWQLTPAASGDTPLTDDLEGLLQTIRTEAITQEGELFYAPDFGWSLLDFLHAQESDLVKIEIDSRIRKKIAKYDEIIAGTVEIQQVWSSDMLNIAVTFKISDGSEHTIGTSLNRIEVDV